MSRITSESLQTAGVESHELAALARQTRGGNFGGHGYGYEDHFAVARLIAAAVRWFEHGEDCLVTLSHPYCWVDDVVIEGEAHEAYAQLKTSPQETWGKDDGRLISQFRRQADICRARQVRRFSLEIVTPHEDRFRHFDTTMPPDLRTTTTTVLFPLETLGLRNDSSLTAALADLCADIPEPSVREHLLRATYGAYHWIRRSSNALTVSRLMTVVAADDSVPLRCSATVAEPALWDSARAALAVHLPGLLLRLAKGFLVYEYLDDERGFIARADSERSSRFLARIVARPPTTMDVFHQELP